MITRRKTIGKSLFLIEKIKERYCLTEHTPEGTLYSRPYDTVDEAINEMRIADREGFLKGDI